MPSDLGSPQLVLVHPDRIDPGVLPELALPFTTIIDARLESSTDPGALITALLVAGCTAFACIGTRAEDVEDFVEEVIEDLGYAHVLTATYRNQQVDDLLAFVRGLEPEAVLALVEETSPLARELERAFPG